MAALLQAILVTVGLLMAGTGPASAEACQHAPSAVTTISAPCAHASTADHTSPAACPRGMAACWSHCAPVPLATFAFVSFGTTPRRAIIQNIPGRDQNGPTRHLPPPKLFS